jgi:hypothetical protein
MVSMQKILHFLEYRNIEGEYFIFKRAKTEMTAARIKPLSVFISNDISGIIFQ